ncbi:MAG: hypothetical protein B7733_03975 [Myxococcales bacterium FL481]|nr:MAG: hypothetical protein B7733_03975 [Myxococcales bacterium FL481]
MRSAIVLSVLGLGSAAVLGYAVWKLSGEPAAPEPRTALPREPPPPALSASAGVARRRAAPSPAAMRAAPSRDSPPRVVTPRPESTPTRVAPAARGQMPAADPVDDPRRRRLKQQVETEAHITDSSAAWTLLFLARDDLQHIAADPTAYGRDARRAAIREARESLARVEERTAVHGDPQQRSKLGSFRPRVQQLITTIEALPE